MKTCDNASVGIIVADLGMLLLIERGTAPAGLAPVAGHVFDDHASYDDAARAELSDELGLTATSLELLGGGWRNNRCRRAAGERGIGHQWQIFGATTAEDYVQPSAREVRSVRWLDPAQIVTASRRTLDYARDRITPEEWEADPGIEPVWVRWFHVLGIVDLSPFTVDDWEAIDARAGRYDLLGDDWDLCPICGAASVHVPEQSCRMCGTGRAEG